MKSRFSLMFLFFVLNLVYSQDLRVISSNQNFLILEYHPTIKDTIITNISGRSFTKFEIPGTRIENAKEFGAAVVAIKAKDTLLKGNDFVNEYLYF